MLVFSPEGQTGRFVFWPSVTYKNGIPVFQNEEERLMYQTIQAQIIDRLKITQN